MLTKRTHDRKWHRFMFHIQNLNISSKIVFLWVLISLLSTFLPWFSLTSWQEKKYYSFSNYTAFAWVIIIIFSVVILFFLISKRNKEKMRYNLSLSLHDHAIIMFSWILLFVLTLSVFFMIKWFSEFSYDVTVFSWITFSFIWAILIIFWGFLLYRTHKAAILNQIYIENRQQMAKLELEEYSEILWKENFKNDNNMTLPI